MKIAPFCLAILLLGVSLRGGAFETDNFSCRYGKLQDVTAHVNAETNRRMQIILTKGRLDFLATGKKIEAARQEMIEDFKKDPVAAAKKPSPVHDDHHVYVRLQGCDKSELHAALRGALASSWFGNLETWVGSQSFSKCLPEKHIYSDGPKGVMLHAGINYTIKVGGVNIGIDKLSHFMTEGADYYEAQMKNKNLSQILQIGENEELGLYGLAATGVKSYGDLAANYQGYQFWKNTTEGSSPYFKCVNNKWLQVRQFDWKDYVNPMMDESVNCSQYASKEMEAAIAQAVADIQRSHNATPTACPLDPASCSRAHEYIPNEQVRKAIVHPACLDVAAQREEGVHEITH